LESKLKLLAAIALICVIGLGVTLGYVHHVQVKQDNAFWDVKNKEFPDNPQVHNSTEPQAFVSVTGHVWILAKGGKTLMFCEGIDKCKYAYGVNDKEMTEAINELFMGLAAKQRAMAQQQPPRPPQTAPPAPPIASAKPKH
jgi:hypothetical protein